MSRWIGTIVLLAVLAPSWGCAHGPRSFEKIASTAPLVRARAVGLSGQKPDAEALPALLARLDDSDPVVRLAAHEELRKRTGQDFGYLPWASPEERSTAVGRWRAWVSQAPAGKGITPSPQLAVSETRKRKVRRIKVITSRDP
jgi:HEAT repeats